MEIYVDKLPNNCEGCPCKNGEYNYCELIKEDHSIGYYDNDKNKWIEKPSKLIKDGVIVKYNCPLKTIDEIKRLSIETLYNYLNQKGYLNIEPYAIDKVLKILLGEEADE